jgi:hypothetical protein
MKILEFIFDKQLTIFDFFCLLFILNLCFEYTFWYAALMFPLSFLSTMFSYAYKPK